MNRQRKVPVDIDFLRRIANEARPLCARHPGPEPGVLPALAAIEVSILSDNAIAKVNARFLSHEGPTDVITFGHGEILVSAETARENGLRFEKPLNLELALYIIHGLLHLNGWSDKTRAQATRMSALQQRVLKEVLSKR